MGRSVDDLFEGMASDHVGVMDLDNRVECDEQSIS